MNTHQWLCSIVFGWLTFMATNGLVFGEGIELRECSKEEVADALSKIDDFIDRLECVSIYSLKALVNTETNWLTSSDEVLLQARFDRWSLDVEHKSHNSKFVSPQNQLQIRSAHKPSKTVHAYDGSYRYSYVVEYSEIDIRRAFDCVPLRAFPLWARTGFGVLPSQLSSLKTLRKELHSKEKVAFFKGDKFVRIVLDISEPQIQVPLILDDNREYFGAKSDSQLHLELCSTTGTIIRSKAFHKGTEFYRSEIDWSKTSGVWIPRKGSVSGEVVGKISWEINSFNLDASKVKARFTIDKNNLPSGTRIKEWLNSKDTSPSVVFTGDRSARQIYEEKLMQRMVEGDLSSTSN